MPSLKTGLLFLIVMTSACASGRPIRPSVGGDQYHIVSEELRATRRSMNLYEAVRELRPFWFTRHVRTGDAITVYFDDQRVGSATQLQRVPISAAGSVRYLSPTEAQVRYGPTHPSGPVIAVESHRRSP
jgi:hypothetical protein